jgi:hypothetical protein
MILIKKKIKYESKIPGKRPPKHYAITTYDKYKDKLKRSKRELNLEQKIVKCFFPDEFKVSSYENEDYDYWHKNFLKEKLKENYEVVLLNNDIILNLHKNVIQNQHFQLLLHLCFLNLCMKLNLIVETN